MAPDTVQPPLPDYKDSLNLPRTEFPMRANLPGREPQWLARWDALGVYARLRASASGRTPFVLHDGPPYANGHLHIGHGLNKILKDMVVRSRQMMGHDSRYVPGWDCHGLPIEWKIEEQYRARGLDKDAVPVVDFRRECRRFAEHWVSVQREEFRRLGITGAWDAPYLTMDFHAEAVIAGEFLKFLMNGSLYQGSKPVLWSPVEKTALAEAEVEYHEVTSHQIWVRFAVAAGGAADLAGAAVVIWTTTPWTIPSNRAVAFNPALAYGLFEVEAAAEGAAARPGERILLALDRAEDSCNAAHVSRRRLLREVPAEELAALALAHPFRGLPGSHGEWDFDVPMLPGEHVTADAGTGFVHTAPSHGDEDYQLGLRHGLPMTHNVLEDGRYRLDLPLFGGQAIITPEGQEGPANVSVIKALHAAGALFAKGRLRHSYPHSWRSKAPLIYRNTPQWFVAIDKPLDDGLCQHGATIRERALRSIDELVQWIPPSGRNRLRAMMEMRPDWVLSRQRAWGVPLTLFVRRGARPDSPDFLLRDPRVNARIVEIFEREGADAWYPNVPLPVLTREGTPEQEAEKARVKARFLEGLVNPDEWDQVFDILDVWFDSGSTHAFVLRDRPDGTPDGIADLYLEGTDQHRGWFHSSLLQACGTIGRAPYRGVLTHGFTLDERGMKMSKSLGNTVAPGQVTKDYGADILRLWVAQSDYTADLRIGPEILKGTADSYRRLRNTLRFILGSLGDGEAEEPATLPELERWVLHRLAEIDADLRRDYEAYDFQGVFRAVFEFATSDLSAFYLDVRKDALYCDGDTPRRRATRWVLARIFERLTAWLAPILPFTMEEAWLERHGKSPEGAEGSIHLLDFPPTPAAWRDDALAARWERIRAARRVVTGALEPQRTAKVIGASLEAAPVVHVPDDLLPLLEGADFADLCITSAITVTADPAPEGAFRLPDVPGVAVVFALAEGDKCQRCWKILPDVGTHAHPGVCARCEAALTEPDGEQ
ncbi:Isoleucyl-tRNA synthetase [Rubellimicrobium thermophilum DSM 16684]|uniref:Isoleucine--tRNA ligase n=1 Tax=Rubellimicrobium thermophilum DSM 16684 TaxID=1123069 RepID=S9QTL3_9RHOB|nr:isoleucine--tRNA ligase [Rubellimicrobium thermophilum]EPX84691.1 Isoleucyl-tRNA synthetase [Rubellimicrobium thermophilum DSM 16684]